MKTFLNCIFEQTFPFIYFFFNKRKVMKKLESQGSDESDFETYKVLNGDILTGRIKEEHERAVKIDDKTSKFVLGLSVSLTVIAAASGSFAKLVLDAEYTDLVAAICGISSMYMLSAGIIALGAFQTLPLYGYGTIHEIHLKNEGDSYLTKALFLQEKVNNVRQIRNEAAYQSLRNGFLILFIALVLSVALLAKPNQVPADLSSDNKNEMSKPFIESNSKAGTKAELQDQTD